jgi:hypothetical protein
MRSMVLFGAACVSLLLSTAPAAFASDGQVTVEFVQPDKFTDVRDRQFASAPDKNPNLHVLRKYMEERPTRYLKAGQTLKIEFTDIDLAGDHRAQLDPQLSDVRLVTSLYPPRIKLNFVLKDQMGAQIRAGQVDLRDLGFDTNSTGSLSESLRYEKRMLDKWLRKEFGGR